MAFARLPLDQFPEQLKKHVDPNAPAPLRLMAARGLVPMGPEVMGTVLVQLAHDADPNVASTAKNQLSEMPAELKASSASAPLPPGVLDYLSDVFRKDDDLLGRLITNRATADETVARIARGCSERLTELVAENDVRLLRCPEIIESLYLNEHSRMSTVDRCVELARRNDVSFANVPALKMLVEDKRSNLKATDEGEVVHDDLAEEQADDLFSQLLAESLAEEDGLDDEGRDRKDDAPEKGANNRTAQIDAMTISERVRLATLGSASDREILIRAGNRLIHMAAVMSPKVQMKDIIGWSSNASLPDGVIRYIANHRRYKKNYMILQNLTNNPKCPPKDAMTLLKFLHAKDLAKVEKNRNVSHQVRRMAKTMKDRKAKRGS